jgi:hypothetical protein
MGRLADAILGNAGHDLKVVFWDDDRELDCAHVNTAWAAIQVSGFKIPYMCSYGVRAGGMTAALIDGLKYYHQTKCIRVSPDPS